MEVVVAVSAVVEAATVDALDETTIERKARGRATRTRFSAPMGSPAASARAAAAMSKSI